MISVSTFSCRNVGQENIRERLISGNGQSRRLGASGAEDFLFAGTSALMLLCANLFPAYWFLSFFALIPLLNRIVKAGPRRALRLGLLFGLSFFGVSLINLCVITPGAALLKIAGGTALFALFGWGVAQARRHWGFNPLIIALLWIALELGVIKFGFSGGLLAEGQASHPLFGGIAALFGFLSISFLIVLFNSLLLYAFETVISLGTARGMSFSRGERKWTISPYPRPVALRLFLVPEGRGPPFRSA